MGTLPKESCGSRGALEEVGWAESRWSPLAFLSS